MAFLPVVLLTAVLVFLCRAAGFMFAAVEPGEFYRRFLKAMPVAVFAVLAVSAVLRQPELLVARLIALAAAMLVMRRTRQFALSIGVGLVCLWIISAVNP